MPKTVTKTYTLYQFSELSEKAQEKAIEWFLTGYPDHDWWDSVYDDAKQIGLKITGFDIGRGNSIDGELTESAESVAHNILKNHGESRGAYKTAATFLRDLENLGDDPDDIHASIRWDNQKEELERDFRLALLEDYLSILRQEYDYLTSEEHAREMIEANEYTFTVDGERED